MSPPPLEQLFREFLTTGNEESLAHWMRRSGPPLRQLGLRLGVAADDVEDLVQETFVAAIQGADRYDAQRPMLPWLKGILTFRAARLARDAVRRKHHYQAAVQSSPTTVPPPDHTHAELDRDVRQAIDDLPERYREPLTHYLLAQRSPVEIAEAMGVKRATVRVRLHRGLERLRDALRRWGAIVLAVLLGRRTVAATAVRAVVVLLLTVAAFHSLPGENVAVPDKSEAVASAPDGRSAEVLSQDSEFIGRKVMAVAGGAEVGGDATLVIRVRGSDKAPVADVGVAFEPAFGRDPVLHRRSHVTDARGNVVCTGLPIGTWNVLTDRGQRATIDVEPGVQEHVLTVAGGRRVTGTVLDCNRQPAANSLVWLSRGVDGPWRGHDVTRTDAAGRFELDEVPVGAFLAARHLRFARSDPHRVTDSDEHVTIQLGTTGGRIALQVTDPDGAPVADGVVFVGNAMDASPLWLAQGAAPWGSPPFTGRTNVRGEFLTGALTPGEHPVFVRAAGHVPYRAMLRVEVGQTRRHVATLAAGAQVPGVVRDVDGNGVANALVVFRHDESSAAIDTYADPDGRFVLECLPTGTGQLLARASGFAAGTTQVDLQVRQQDCEITLAPTRTIVGRVLLDGKAPRSGSLLRASWPPSALNDSSAVARIDDQGRFVFTNATSCSRPKLRIRLAEEPMWRHVDSMSEWDEQNVTVRLPDSFVGSSWLHGNCLGDDGRAIANARIHLCRDGRWGEVGRTDASGSYRVGPLAPGSYRVFVESTQRESPTVVTEPIVLARQTDQRVDVTAGASGDVAIELRRRDGKPVTDVLMTIQRVDLHRRFAMANKARVRQRLEAGQYVLSVMGGSVAWIDEHRFTVRPGAVTPVSVELEPAHRCTLVLAGFPQRARSGPTTVVIRSVANDASAATVTLLPDAPLRIGAVLAPGSYRLEHTSIDGTLWRGNFDIATGAESMRPMRVMFAPIGRLREVGVGQAR